MTFDMGRLTLDISTLSPDKIVAPRHEQQPDKIGPFRGKTSKSIVDAVYERAYFVDSWKMRGHRPRLQMLLHEFCNAFVSGGEFPHERMRQR